MEKVPTPGLVRPPTPGCRMHSTLSLTTVSAYYSKSPWQFQVTATFEMPSRCVLFLSQQAVGEGAEKSELAR